MNVYHVVSEFKFDVAKAVMGSEQLQNSVNAVSSSVQNAMNSIQGYASGLVMNLTGLQGGLMGLIGGALNSADKFLDYQLGFTQIIDSNAAHMGKSFDSLNEKMEFSAEILQDIVKDARKFSIPASALAEMTKSMTAMLLPKNLAGENFVNARNMSRNLMKSSSILGVNPYDVQGQLIRAIEGSASMGDTLFRRLSSEAPEAFKAYNVDTSSSKGFNALDASKRFDVLSMALNKFTGNTELLEKRALSLSGMFQNLKDTFYGIGSVLRPLVDALLPLLQKVFKIAIKWIQNEGAEIIKMLSSWLDKIEKDPKELFVNLAQLAGLGKDFKSASWVAGITVSLIHLKELMGFLTKLPIIGPLLGFLGSKLVALIKWIHPSGQILKALSVVFRTFFTTIIPWIGQAIWALIPAFLTFTGVLFSVLIPLQGLTRAWARAKIETLEWFANKAVEITFTFGRIKDAIEVLLMPIQDLIKGWEDLWYWIISGTFFLDLGLDAMKGFAGGLETFATAILYVWSVIRGAIAGITAFLTTTVFNIMKIFENLKAGKILKMFEGTGNILGDFTEAANNEFDKSFNRAFGQEAKPDGKKNSTDQHVPTPENNIYVTMNNSFKEVLQPDRIAFTIKDQLVKQSLKRTQARANSTGSLQAKAI